MIELDDRARAAAAGVRDLFDGAPIPAAPTSRSRRLLLTAAIAATIGAGGGGLALLGTGGDPPSTDEPQVELTHYGIADLPAGWRRSVVQTQPLTSPDESELVLLAQAELMFSVERFPAAHEPPGEVVTVDGVDVTLMPTGVTTWNAKSVYRVRWQRDGVTLSGTTLNRDATLQYIPTVEHIGGAWGSTDGALTVWRMPRGGALLQAILSPVLSARPLDLDEVTAYAAPDGQSGFSLVLLRGVDRDSFGGTAFIDFITDSEGFSTAHDHDWASGRGVFAAKQTGDPAGRMELTTTIDERGDLLIAGGFGMKEGVLAQLLARIGKVDAATWEKWVAESDTPPVTNSETTGTAVAVEVPADPLADTLNFFVGTDGRGMVSLATFPLGDNGVVEERLCDPRSPRWPNPSRNDCRQVVMSAPPVVDPQWWQNGDGERLIGFVRLRSVRTVEIVGSQSTAVAEVDPIAAGETFGWRIAATAVPANDGRITIVARDANGRELARAELAVPPRAG